jgi:hypothetical protein
MRIEKEPLEQKLLRKQNKAEENRNLVLKSKIDKARDSYARASTESNSDSNTKKENKDENLKTA